MVCGVTECVNCDSATPGDSLYGDVEENVLCDECVAGKYPLYQAECVGECYILTLQTDTIILYFFIMILIL